MTRYKNYEVDDQRFYQIPKSLFGNENYKGLSPLSKLVYAFLRDRMELSKKNNWVNEDGDVYLLFAREKIAELLEMSVPSVITCFKQLVEFDLVEEIRQGLGKPNIIFICHVETNPQTKETRLNLKNLMSGSKKILCQDIKNFNASDTECSDTDKNETDKDLKNKGIFVNKNVEFQKLTNDSQELFDYYKDYYKKYTGKEHPFINQATKAKINKLTKSLEVYDGEYNKTLDVSLDYLEDMVAKYFNNNYQCDRNINHFLDENILKNLWYQANSEFVDNVG
jgi:hypothetical protein